MPLRLHGAWRESSSRKAPASSEPAFGFAERITSVPSARRLSISVSRFRFMHLPPYHHHHHHHHHLYHHDQPDEVSRLRYAGAREAAHALAPPTAGVSSSSSIEPAAALLAMATARTAAADSPDLSLAASAGPGNLSAGTPEKAFGCAERFGDFQLV